MGDFDLPTVYSDLIDPLRTVEFSSGNEITLLHCGVELFPALIEAIDGAKWEVYLETYLFAADDVGLAVLNSLVRAASRGVTVSLIADWLGTGSERCAFIANFLRRTNVTFRVFNRWFHRGVARTHRKICVIDKEVAFVGGININQDLKSADGRERLPAPRWDFSVRLSGPLAQVIQREVAAQWLRLGHLKVMDRIQLHNDLRCNHSPRAQTDSQVGFIACDNLHNRFTIQAEYIRALNSARKYIVLANPYFAPGRTFRDALTSAARRGVDVTLLLGVGQYQFQDSVARSYYPKLLRSGVKLVEYKKTQLHAKVAVIDDQWATVGSSNCDGLSLFVNLEANIVVHDRRFAQTLRGYIRDGVRDGVAVKPADYLKVRLDKRLMHGISFLVYRGIMRLITLNAFA